MGSKTGSHEKSLIDRESVFIAMRQITIDCPKYVLDLRQLILIIEILESTVDRKKGFHAWPG
jgi:hypothetical protein